MIWLSASERRKDDPFFRNSHVRGASVAGRDDQLSPICDSNLSDNRVVYSSEHRSSSGSCNLRTAMSWDIFLTMGNYSLEPYSETSSAQYDRARLDELVVVEDDYSGPLEVGHWGRIVISRGCTVILVIFLFNSRFKSSDSNDPRTHRQPDSQVTPYLSRAAGQAIRSSIGSRRAEESEERWSCWCYPGNFSWCSWCWWWWGCQHLKYHSSNAAEYILPMLWALLDVVSMIAHPVSVEEAKKISHHPWWIYSGWVSYWRFQCFSERMIIFPPHWNDWSTQSQFHKKETFAFDEEPLPTCFFIGRRKKTWLCYPSSYEMFRMKKNAWCLRIVQFYVR